MNLPGGALILLGVVGAVLTETSEIIRINPQGDTQTRSVGSSIVFTCLVDIDIDVDPQLRWHDMEGRVIDDLTGRLYIERDGKEALKLYITNIVEQDAGQYSCKGTVGGNAVEARVKLLLYKDITFDNAPSPQHPVLHRNELIKCQVSGQPIPKVTWRHNGKKIVTGDRYVYDQKGLIINNITEEDNGRYLCRAEVSADGRLREKPIDVEVHIPPKITEPLGDEEGVQEQEVTIACKAVGKPDPKYEFNKGNIPVWGTDRIIVDGNAGEIHFRPLRKEDEGKYTCKAINGAGDAESVGNLKVIVPPKIIDFLNKTAPEGQEQTLVCIASGDPPAQMSIRKFGHNFDYVEGDNEGGRIIVETTEPGRLEMTVSNLAPEDSSNYTCKAKNIGGEHSKNGTLVVHYKPRFKPGHIRHVYNWAGKKRNMTCTAQGEPEPSVKWFRGDRQLTNNETYTLHEMGRTTVLQVKVREEDQGWIYGLYRCEAKNPMGTGELDMELLRATVPSKPKAVEVKIESPTMVLYTILPPVDNGGVEIFGYRVEYENTVQDFQIGKRNMSILPVFLLGEDIHIENLRPSTPYIFRFRAKNEVGVGNYYEYTHTTEDIRAPYPIVLNSDPEGQYAYSYVLKWDKPRTGGLPIKEYEFKYQRVEVFSNTRPWEVSKVLDEFTRHTVLDVPSRPMLHYTLESLKPNTYYKVEVRARNDIGTSVANPDFVFKTKDDPHATTTIFSTTTVTTVARMQPDSSIVKYTTATTKIVSSSTTSSTDHLYEQRQQGSHQTPSPTTIQSSIPTSFLSTPSKISDVDQMVLDPYATDPPALVVTGKELEQGIEPSEVRRDIALGTGAIIGIVIAVFFIFLLIVDISCYFMNDCGVLMCICVHLCGKQHAVAKEKAMEEGERDRLKDPEEEEEEVKEKLTTQDNEAVQELDSDDKIPLTHDTKEGFEEGKEMIDPSDEKPQEIETDVKKIDQSPDIAPNEQQPILA